MKLKNIFFIIFGIFFIFFLIFYGKEKIVKETEKNFEKKNSKINFDTNNSKNFLRKEIEFLELLNDSFQIIDRIKINVKVLNKILFRIEEKEIIEKKKVLKKKEKDNIINSEQSSLKQQLKVKDNEKIDIIEAFPFYKYNEEDYMKDFIAALENNDYFYYSDEFTKEEKGKKIYFFWDREIKLIENNFISEIRYGNYRINELGNKEKINVNFKKDIVKKSFVEDYSLDERMKIWNKKFPKKEKNYYYYFNKFMDYTKNFEKFFMNIYYKFVKQNFKNLKKLFKKKIKIFFFFESFTQYFFENKIKIKEIIKKISKTFLVLGIIKIFWKFRKSLLIILKSFIKKWKNYRRNIKREINLFSPKLENENGNIHNFHWIGGGKLQNGFIDSGYKKMFFERYIDGESIKLFVEGEYSNEKEKKQIEMLAEIKLRELSDEIWIKQGKKNKKRKWKIVNGEIIEIVPKVFVKKGINMIPKKKFKKINIDFRGDVRPLFETGYLEVFGDSEEDISSSENFISEKKEKNI